MHSDVVAIWSKIVYFGHMSSFNQKLLIFFLYELENICCMYSLEAPWQSASNVYWHHIFLWRNRKNILLIDLHYLELCIYLGPDVQNTTKLLANIMLKFLS